MNKQQLASKIWESANKMRSKIEANEYKDYILGFIFYKFLSETEVARLKARDFAEEDLPSLVEDDEETVEFVKGECGYFIAYDNLFSTWVAKGGDFEISNVRDALSAFSRNIDPARKRVFDGIFDTLQTGLSKLGTDARSQSKAARDLIYLIKDIPMDGRADYDVLGFIYEYLISNFAANAGKKAGEFYTPHEVSMLMSEIVSWHLVGRENITIYDPTSGSGSLLINIGKAVARRNGDPDSIKYYAQELKENTYNLTRMNLVMRGILPDNIVARNGDTLEDDWPWFDTVENKDETYDPLFVDAVVSNPPYSQSWDPEDKELDPRFKFGVAPKSKADYAFLLHDLYHLRPDGIMCIVLPHGVLFRGGEEGTIRKNLVENRHIQAIIGLPANIFFGTGIPTIVMVLRKQRESSDVLVVDASKHFVKEGKNNKLRASDIRRIVDAIMAGATVDKFSRLVTINEIRANDYNLNIPRYVDSSEAAENWDVYATMFGGVPKAEVDALDRYWKVWPSLKGQLYGEGGGSCLAALTDDVAATVEDNVDVVSFLGGYRDTLSHLPAELRKRLVDGLLQVDAVAEEDHIAEQLRDALSGVALVDEYDAYQALDDAWTGISGDLEVIQTDGSEAVRKVDPNMVIKKKDGKETEVQDGWIGHILPFELVQSHILTADVAKINSMEERLSVISSSCSELIDSLDAEQLDSPAINDSNDAFVLKEINAHLNSEMKYISSPEIRDLEEYLKLLDQKAKKQEKLAFIENHSDVSWQEMESNKDGTYSKAKVASYIGKLKLAVGFPVDSFEYVLAQAKELLDEEKSLKTASREAKHALEEKTKEVVEDLSDAQCDELLAAKWIDPLISDLLELSNAVVSDFIAKVVALNAKYATTYSDVCNQIAEAENELAAMLGQLTGNEHDMAGIAELRKLLGGE